MRKPRAFRFVAMAALVTAGFLLFSFLRRLGGGEAACLLAVAAFGLSPPVRECLDNYFLAEPMTLLLVVAFLLSVEAGASVAVLSLIAVLGTVSKEIMLPLIPVIWLARRDRKGDRRALVETALVSVPVILIAVTFRLWWTPYVKIPLPRINPDYFLELFDHIRETWQVWLESAIVGGLMPLAVLGAFRRVARSFLRRYGFVLALSLLVPFLNPSRLPFSLHFLVRDYSRYLLYAMPCILPLCLFAIDRIWPHLESQPEPKPSSRLTNILAVCAIAILLLSPFAMTDRYRRAEPRERYGYYVHILVDQSLQTAGLLERGQSVEWVLRVDAPPEGSPYPPPPRAIRWFLREGWRDSLNSYGKDVHMMGGEAGFLLPSFLPQDVEIELSLHSSSDMLVHVYVNGVHTGQAMVERQPSDYTFRAPATALFRGDNIVTLRKTKGHAAALSLRRIKLRPTGSPPGHAGRALP
jgi:hypothetical protein